MDQLPNIDVIKEELKLRQERYQEEISNLRVATHYYAAEDIRRFQEWDSQIPTSSSVVRLVVINSGNDNDVYVVSGSGISGSDFEISDSMTVWLIRSDDPHYHDLVACRVGDMTSRGLVTAVQEAADIVDR